MSENMLENTVSMVDTILKDFGAINKNGASKSDAISESTDKALLSAVDDNGLAMQALDKVASAIPGGAQVMGAAKVVKGLAQGDVKQVIDGATDFIPGVKQAKNVMKMKG